MKDFFQKTWVKITGWAMLVTGVVVLYIGGTSQEAISKGAALTIAIVIAIGALITFITGHITAKKLKELENK